eukprot:321704-Prymnesium_polylepis.1
MVTDFVALEAARPAGRKGCRPPAGPVLSSTCLVCFTIFTTNGRRGLCKNCDVWLSDRRNAR